MMYLIDVLLCLVSLVFRSSFAISSTSTCLNLPCDVINVTSCASACVPRQCPSGMSCECSHVRLSVSSSMDSFCVQKFPPMLYVDILEETVFQYDSAPDVILQAYDSWQGDIYNLITISGDVDAHTGTINTAEVGTKRVVYRVENAIGLSDIDIRLFRVLDVDECLLPTDHAHAPMCPEYSLCIPCLPGDTSCGGREFRCQCLVGFSEVEKNCIDTRPPRLSLNGPTEIRVSEGLPYIDMGFVALDSMDGDVSDDVSVTVDKQGLFETVAASIGTFILSFHATDSHNNFMTATRIVHVETKYNVIPFDRCLVELDCPVGALCLLTIRSVLLCVCPNGHRAIKGRCVNTSLPWLVLREDAVVYLDQYMKYIDAGVDVWNLNATGEPIMLSSDDIDVFVTISPLGLQDDECNGIGSLSLTTLDSLSCYPGAYAIQYCAENSAGQWGAPVTRSVFVKDTDECSKLRPSTEDVHSCVRFSSYSHEAPCSPNARCTNLFGSYNCLCDAKRGFITNASGTCEQTQRGRIKLIGDSVVILDQGELFKDAGAVYDYAGGHHIVYAAELSSKYEILRLPGVYWLSYGSSVEAYVITRLLIVNDVDECATPSENSVVPVSFSETGTKCINTYGSFDCSCTLPGFEKRESKCPCVDVEAPTVILYGPRIINITQFSRFSDYDPGAYAIDNGGDILGEIELHVPSPSFTDIVGVYNVTYVVRDSADNVGFSFREVLVLDENECTLSDTHPHAAHCYPYGTCYNLIGGFRCECETGFFTEIVSTCTPCTCSGIGSCHRYTGICLDCAQGNSVGLNCESCAPSFVRSNGTCVPTVEYQVLFSFINGGITVVDNATITTLTQRLGLMYNDIVITRSQVSPVPALVFYSRPYDNRDYGSAYITNSTIITEEYVRSNLISPIPLGTRSQLIIRNVIAQPAGTSINLKALLEGIHYNEIISRNVIMMVIIVLSSVAICVCSVIVVLRITRLKRKFKETALDYSLRPSGMLEAEGMNANDVPPPEVDNGFSRSPGGEFVSMMSPSSPSTTPLSVSTSLDEQLALPPLPQQNVAAELAEVSHMLTITNDSSRQRSYSYPVNVYEPLCSLYDDDGRPFDLPYVEPVYNIDQINLPQQRKRARAISEITQPGLDLVLNRILHRSMDNSWLEGETVGCTRGNSSNDLTLSGLGSPVPFSPFYCERTSADGDEPHYRWQHEFDLDFRCDESIKD